MTQYEYKAVVYEPKSGGTFYSLEVEQKQFEHLSDWYSRNIDGWQVMQVTKTGMGWDKYWLRRATESR